MKKQYPFVAVGLILVGVLLLLDRTHVVDLGWWTALWAVVALYGLYRLVEGFRKPERGGIVWGTIFLSIGLYQVAEDFGVVALPHGMLFPALLVVIGAGFLLAVIRQPREWHVAVPAVTLLAVGSVMILADLGMLQRWAVLDLLHTWWPAALILFGAALLLNRNGAKG